MSENSIYYEYLQLTKQYQSTYGENTVVLLQVGAFFEVYGFRNNQGEVQESEICEFSRICNLNISEKSNDFFDMIFEMNLKSLDHLNVIIKNLKELDRVSMVKRLFIN